MLKLNIKLSTKLHNLRQALVLSKDYCATLIKQNKQAQLLTQDPSSTSTTASTTSTTSTTTNSEPLQDLFSSCIFQHLHITPIYPSRVS